MKYTILLLFISSTLFAETKFRSSIIDIDYGENNEEPMLLLESGRVAFYPAQSLSNKRFLSSSLKRKQIYDFTLDDKQSIIYIQKVTSLKEKPQQNLSFVQEDEPYKPTIISSLEEAVDIFNVGRKDAKRVSECFNRAQVWSYEWDKKHDIKTSKVWLFFTRKYIRRYRFEWWFHVAPSVLVNIDNEVKERVMDLKYLNSPSTIKQWTNVFIRDRSDCPIIDKFSDYAHYPESALCYVQRSNPFYYQPVDLERLEFRGEEKTNWMDSDLTSAYLEAFDQKEMEL